MRVGIPISRLGLALAAILVGVGSSASVIAAPIDLSRFNAVFLDASLQVTESYTLYDHSSGTDYRDGFGFDSAKVGDFARGHFSANTYTAAWDVQIPLAPGKIWAKRGSISLTLSSTDFNSPDPPAITKFRIEDFNDYPGSPTQPQFFHAVKVTQVIAGQAGWF